MKNILIPCLGALLWAPPVTLGADADPMILESRCLRLGIPGQKEWESALPREVDAERMELHFEAAANAAENTVLIRHRGVKLAWSVLLNGRKLGLLTRDESLMESVFSVPARVLRDGENVLSINAPPALDDIDVGPVRWVAAPPAEATGGALVRVNVRDSESKVTVPCRLTVTRPDGTLQPLAAHPAEEVAVRTGVVYTRAGNAQIQIPPGRYVLHAGRGMEWSVASTTFELVRGENPPIHLELTREVDTRGWVAVDSHIHTLTHSRHGDATTAERALTIAGEGIELAIATDHNHHTDYAPVVAELGLTGAFTPVIGNEVTTRRGHFNAFPVEAAAPLVNAAEEDWSRLLPAIRNTPGVRVITLNHPRDLHGGFIPFGKDHFDSDSGVLLSGGTPQIDAVEVITSGAMQSDIGLLFRDWFALLNHGHRIAAIGSSDTHDVSRFILGQGRTYVAAPDAHPGRVPLEDVWRSYHSGRVLVSMGLFVTLRVDGKFGAGDLVTPAGNTLDVETEVQGPSWAKADHVALYANGRLVREANIESDAQALPGRKALIHWSLPKPDHDIHLVAIATGPGVVEPFWEIPRPYQPASKRFEPRVIGATNPVWIDCDASGSFDSAIRYARDLTQKHSGDRKGLEKALARYDASVAIQVRALLESPPTPAP